MKTLHQMVEDAIRSADKLSSCTGKHKYPREDSAINAANAMTNKKQEPFEHYKCRYCDGWHVGHPKQDGVMTITLDKPAEGGEGQ